MPGSRSRLVVPVPAVGADECAFARLAVKACRHSITSGLTPMTVSGWLCSIGAGLLDSEGARSVTLVVRSLRPNASLLAEGAMGVALVARSM